MGYHARVSADVDASAEHDIAPLAPEAPVSGYVWRNGRAIPVTLETGAMTPRMDRALPEQMIMAALLLVSFAAPIFHLLG